MPVSDTRNLASGVRKVEFKLSHLLTSLLLLPLLRILLMSRQTDSVARRGALECTTYTRVPVGLTRWHDSIPPQQDGDCRRPVTAGQAFLDCLSPQLCPALKSTTLECRRESHLL